MNTKHRNSLDQFSSVQESVISDIIKNDAEFKDSGAEELRKSTSITEQYHRIARLFLVKNKVAYPCMLILVVALFLSVLIFPDINSYISLAPEEIRSLCYRYVIISALLAVLLHLLLCALYITGGEGKDKFHAFKIWSFIAFLIATCVWIYLVQMYMTETKHSMNQVTKEACERFNHSTEEIDSAALFKCIAAGSISQQLDSENTQESDHFTGGEVAKGERNFNYNLPATDTVNWTFFYDVAINFGVCLFITIGLVILTFHISGAIPDRSYNNILFPVIVTLFFFLAATITYNEAEKLTAPSFTVLIIYAALANLFVFGIQIVTRSSASVAKHATRSAFFNVTPKDSTMHSLMNFLAVAKELNTEKCRPLNQYETVSMANQLTLIASDIEFMAYSSKDDYSSADTSNAHIKSQLTRARMYQRFAVSTVKRPGSVEINTMLKSATEDIVSLSRGQHIASSPIFMKSVEKNLANDKMESKTYRVFMSALTPVVITIATVLILYYFSIGIPEQYQKPIDEIVRVYFADNKLFAFAGVAWFMASVLMRLNPKWNAVLASAEKSRKWFAK